MYQENIDSKKNKLCCLPTVPSLAMSSKKTNNNNNKNDQERELPHDFDPSSYAVIIGRGKKIRETVGNQRLRVIASLFLPEYSTAKENRATKTRLVDKVMDLIKSACQVSNCDCGGKRCRRIAFVRQTKNGQWFEVSNSVAREKIGYIFRDLLASNYLSSSKSKTAKKIQRQHQEQQQQQQQRLREHEMQQQEQHQISGNVMSDMDDLDYLLSSPLIECEIMSNGDDIII
jgi:hypothetical protein